MRVLNPDARFPEGPAWLDGKLYYAEYGADRVSVWDGNANQVFWQSGNSGPAAIVPFGGGFAVTAYTSGELALLSRAGTPVRSYRHDDSGAPLSGPNDAVADAHGGLYVTTSGPWESAPIVGTVHYLDAHGRFRLAADDLHYANGIALSPDGRRLFLNESSASRVISFAVQSDGILSDRRLLVRMAELGEAHDAYPDGIKLGPDGNLYIGLFSAGRIVVMDLAGRLIRKVEVPAASTPNLAFSPDGATLYVAAVDEPHLAPYRGRMLAMDNR